MKSGVENKQRRYVPWTLFPAAVFAIVAAGVNFGRHASFMPLFFWMLAGVCAGYGLITLLCRHPRAGGFFRQARKIAQLLLLAGVLVFAALEVAILANAHSDPSGPADCVLVLGAGLRGEEISATLMRRLDAALDYLEAYPGTPVVVSGGQGDGETLSEAEAMYRYLVGRGVDRNLIIKEERSTDTNENVAFSVPLMPEHTRTVAVATSEFHLLRARLLLRRAGFEPMALAAETPLMHLKVLYCVRESFSLVFTFFGW